MWAQELPDLWHVHVETHQAGNHALSSLCFLVFVCMPTLNPYRSQINLIFYLPLHFFFYTREYQVGKEIPTTSNDL